jgi:hypothetical protein
MPRSISVSVRGLLDSNESVIRRRLAEVESVVIP